MQKKSKSQSSRAAPRQKKGKTSNQGKKEAQKEPVKAQQEPSEVVMSRIVIAPHIFRSIEGDASFKLRDGKELKGLLDLAEELESMGEDVFFHHVTPERNDFSNWVHGVFLDSNLAEDIRLATRERMQSHIMKKILKEMLK